MKHTSKITQLTSLRYIAALMVFVSHLNWDNSSVHVQSIFEQGYLGVSFFFVLSGFVLSYSYGEKLRNGLVGSKEYILLRVARLSPLHFLTALPFIFLGLYKESLDYVAVFTNLMYLQSWIPSSVYYFSLNAPSWSLSNEMFFYIAFTLFVGFSLKKLAVITFGLFIVVFMSAFFVTTLTSPDLIISGSNTFTHWLFYIFPGFRVLEFLVGMMLFQLFNKGFSLSNKLLLPSYILLITAMYFGGEVPEAYRMSLYYLPFISFFLYCHLNLGRTATAVLSNKSFILLGEASFAFYLIHQPILIALKVIFVKLTINYSDVFFFFFSLVVISVLSIIIYIFYEKKAETYLKNKIKKNYSSEGVSTR